MQMSCDGWRLDPEVARVVIREFIANVVEEGRGEERRGEDGGTAT